MAREKKVVRPTKRSEYTIEFATVSAQRGWIDLCATSRNAVADSWDFLTLKGDARIWFSVHDGTVYLEQVHTHHPNATK